MGAEIVNQSATFAAIEERLKKVVFIEPPIAHGGRIAQDGLSTLLADARWLAAELRWRIEADAPKEIA